MKNLLILSLVLFCGTLVGQNLETPATGEKVIIDNDKIKVIEHVSIPKSDVCGVGMHHHEPHLTIVVSDAKVRITPENGDAQEMEIKAGASIWFDAAETHSVSNVGDKPTKMILVYLKE